MELMTIELNGYSGMSSFVTHGGQWYLYSSDISFTSQAYRITHNYAMIKSNQIKVICMFYMTGVE